MSSISPRPLRSSTRIPDDVDDVLVGQRPRPEPESIASRPTRRLNFIRPTAERS